MTPKEVRAMLDEHRAYEDQRFGVFESRLASLQKDVRELRGWMIGIFVAMLSVGGAAVLSSCV